MTEVELLADINSGVGVVIALAGTIIAAPDGIIHAARSFGAWLRHRGIRLRDLAGRAFPSFRRVPAPPRVAQGSANVGLALIASARGHAWLPTAPVHERIERLHHLVIELDGRLEGYARDLRREADERNEAIAELRTRTKTEIARIEELVAARDREATAIDARALPVVGVGILVSGVEDFWAGLLPWHLGWLVPVAVLAYAVRVAWLVFAPRLRGAKTEAASTSPAPVG